MSHRFCVGCLLYKKLFLLLLLLLLYSKAICVPTSFFFFLVFYGMCVCLQKLLLVIFWPTFFWLIRETKKSNYISIYFFKKHSGTTRCNMVSADFWVNYRSKFNVCDGVRPSCSTLCSVPLPPPPENRAKPSQNKPSERKQKQKTSRLVGKNFCLVVVVVAVDVRLCVVKTRYIHTLTQPDNTHNNNNNKKNNVAKCFVSAAGFGGRGEGGSVISCCYTGNNLSGGGWWWNFNWGDDCIALSCEILQWRGVKNLGFAPQMVGFKVHRWRHWF